MKFLNKIFGQKKKKWKRPSKKSCPKCISWRSMEWSCMWHRAWNILCQQGSASSGYRCYECGHFEWDKTPEEEITNDLKLKVDWISLPYDHPDFKDRNISIKDYVNERGFCKI